MDRRDAYQLDGDTAGECRTMTAEVRPGALIVRVPRAGSTPQATSEELVEVGTRVDVGSESQERTHSAG